LETFEEVAESLGNNLNLVLSKLGVLGSCNFLLLRINYFSFDISF